MGVEGSTFDGCPSWKEPTLSSPASKAYTVNLG